MKYLKEYCKKFNLNYNDIKTIVNTLDDGPFEDDDLFKFRIHASVRGTDKMLFYVNSSLTFIYEYEDFGGYSIRANYYKFSSFKSGLNFYKEQIENKIYKVYSTSSDEIEREKANEAKKLIQVIDELLPILNGDLGSKEYDNCVEFIENDLYDVCKTLNIERFYKDCVFGFKFNSCKIIIDNGIKQGDINLTFYTTTSMDSLDISLEILDEDITFKRTVSTLEEFKTAFRKIISLLEDKDEYKDFCIKLEKIL